MPFRSRCELPRERAERNRMGGVQLAFALAGKVGVPLPVFFSPAQLGYVVAMRRPIFFSCSNKLLATQSGIDRQLIGPKHRWADLPGVTMVSAGPFTLWKARVQPRGRTTQNRLNRMVRRCAGIRGRSNDDRLVSFPCFGCRYCWKQSARSSFRRCPERMYISLLDSWSGSGRDASGIATVFEIDRPTTSVLVPRLLKRWVAELQASGEQTPSSLRYVAVGGALVPERIAHDAWNLGVRVYEGLGCRNAAPPWHSTFRQGAVSARGAASKRPLCID
jgi:hypothetical protein